MNVVCPGTWRALCTGLRSASFQSSPAPPVWVLTIQPLRVTRSFRLGLSPQLPASRSLRIAPIRPRTSCYCVSQVGGSSRANHVRLSSSTGDEKPSQERSGWLLKRLEIADDEIKAIFGEDISQAYGNRIIELVQEQRVEGTIDGDIPEVLPRHKEQALAWLRENVPVDEDQAILTRLEREEEKSLKPQAQSYGMEGPYAESVLEQTRKYNIERLQKEEKEKEAQAQAKGKPLPLSREQALVHRRQESEALVKKWKDKVKADDLHSVPQMSFIRRVGPATLVTAGVVFLCVMFAQNYTPPSQAARLFPSISPAVATICVLIGMNCIVWAGWRSLPLRRSMMRMFCLVPAYTYPSSMIGNLFSHQLFRHLLTNMVALWFIGTNCKQLSLFEHCHVPRLTTIHSTRRNWPRAFPGCIRWMWRCSFLRIHPQHRLT